MLPTLLLATMEVSELVGLSRAFKECAGGWRGESGRPLSVGLIILGDMDPEAASFDSPSSFGSSVDFALLLLSLFFFFDLLRASSSFIIIASLTRSSSSRVFLRPLSTMGISSTSSVSSYSSSERSPAPA
jgi:hypothetical protein